MSLFKTFKDRYQLTYLLIAFQNQSKVTNLGMYITQTLKNNREKRKRNRRISSIIINQKLTFETTFDSIVQRDVEEKRRKQKEESTHSKSKFGLGKVNEVNQNTGNAYLQQQSERQQNFRIKKHLKRTNILTEVSIEKNQVKPGDSKSRNKSVRKLDKLSLLQKKTILPWVSQQGEGLNLAEENINKLNSFIRGAYLNQYEEFSDFVNLGSIDRCREDFYIFKNLYEKTQQQNSRNKISIKDVKSQNLRDMIFLNDHKDDLQDKSLKRVMKKLKVAF